ncbi:MAG: hypothetical protein ABWY45_14895 [Mycobacterium sp.]
MSSNDWHDALLALAEYVAAVEASDPGRPLALLCDGRVGCVEADRPPPGDGSGRGPPRAPGDCRVMTSRLGRGLPS